MNEKERNGHSADNVEKGHGEKDRERVDSGYEFDFGADETPWRFDGESANEANGNGTVGNGGEEGLQPAFETADDERDLGADTPRNGYGAPRERSPQKPKKTGKGKRIACIFGGIGIAVVSFFTGFLSYGLSLDEELRSLIKIKNTVQSEYYEEITDEEFYGALFNAVNDDLLDAYSWYMDENEFAEYIKEGTGEWSGLGLTFSVQDEAGNARMLITSVSGNSPAERAGIQAGSLIVGYGASEENVVYDTKFENFERFLAERQKGENFTLCIETSGARSFLTIAKESFMENYVFYRSKTTAYRFSGANATETESYQGALSALGETTGYIRLTQFNGNAATQFKKAMTLFKEEGKKNLVLDLRANGGGYMDILQEISAYFCKTADAKTPLVATAQTRDGDKQNFRATGNLYDEYFAQDSKIYVLADNGTASASECLMDYGVCGYEDICLSYRGEEAKTYGKGIMQTTYPFGLIGSVDAIKLTTAKIYWPVSGNCIHGVGVTLENGCKWVAEGVGDGEIEAALLALSVG